MASDLIRALTPAALGVIACGMMIFGMTSRVDSNKFNTASNFAIFLAGGATGVAQGGRSQTQQRQMSGEGGDRP
ncbi:MAG: hypothetical protein ACRC62_15715 [Microcoleus sp.]